MLNSNIKKYRGVEEILILGERLPFLKGYFHFIEGGTNANVVILSHDIERLSSCPAIYLPTNQITYVFHYDYRCPRKKVCDEDSINNIAENYRPLYVSWKDIPQKWKGFIKNGSVKNGDEVYIKCEKPFYNGVEINQIFRGNLIQDGKAGITFQKGLKRIVDLVDIEYQIAMNEGKAILHTR